MQYVLLIYQGTTPLPTDPDAWATLSEEEQKAIYKDYSALNKTQGVSPGLTLGLPEDATTVQVKDGKTVTAGAIPQRRRRRLPHVRDRRPRPRHRAGSTDPSRASRRRHRDPSRLDVLVARTGDPTRPSRRCYPRRRLVVVVWIESPVLG
jgi:hypothetical protein